MMERPDYKSPPRHEWDRITNPGVALYVDTKHPLFRQSWDRVKRLVDEMHGGKP